MGRRAGTRNDKAIQATDPDGKSRADTAGRNAGGEPKTALETRPSRAGGETNRVGNQERRRFPRAKVAGTAIAVGDGRYVGSYLVRNLSAGGVYLIGDNNLAVGQAVQLLIRVGEHLQSIEAEVVRRERLPSGERGFAAAFRNLSAEVEDAFQHLAQLAIDGAKAGKQATVLLLGAPSLTLFDLENGVRSLGYEAQAVATPLDAISLLSGGVQHVAAVAVVCDYAADPLGFLSFLKDAYPQVHRVALPGASPPAQFARAVESGVVEAVLAEPWRIDSLSRALRPSGSC